MRPLICLALAVFLFHSSVHAQAVEEESLIHTHGVKINVDDMERAVSFYSQKLGFEIEDRSDYPRSVVLKSGDRDKLILFRVKKLQKAEPGDTSISLTLQVNDLDQSIATMRSRGVEFAEKEKRKEGVGYAIYIRDPFGRRISLMHQTIVKVEPFKEPKLYNYGFYIPDMATGRDFYSRKLGFIVRSEKYLPLDLPLGHRDNTFAFMLHYRPGIRPIKSAYPHAAPFYTIVFETRNLQTSLEELKRAGVKILSKPSRKGTARSYVFFEDPFGNVSELLEVRMPQTTLLGTQGGEQWRAQRDCGCDEGCSKSRG